MAEPHEDYTKLGKICAAAVPKKIKRGNNKRTNRHIVFNNEEHTLAEWSRILGVSYATIKYRANHNLPLINVMSKTGKFDISKKRDSKKRHFDI